MMMLMKMMMMMMMMMMEEVADNNDDDIFASIRGKSGLTFFSSGSREVLSYLGVDNIFHLRQYLWWRWPTLYLQACHVRVTVGASGLFFFFLFFSCFCMTSFER